MVSNAVVVKNIFGFEQEFWRRIQEEIAESVIVSKQWLMASIIHTHMYNSNSEKKEMIQYKLKEIWQVWWANIFAQS